MILINTTIYDPFSVCFNAYKLKYVDYDESITNKRIVNQYDKVNVFINLESVFKSLSTINGLEEKICLKSDFTELIISNIMNLIAHYKRFFVNNGFDTRVYLYYTDLSSLTFWQHKYNYEYRSYYLEKFNNNPKFCSLTDKLKSEILPDVKTICDYIPNIYTISCKNIEGSVIPYFISKQDESRKNFIITGEVYDTQYTLLNNFCCHYINRTGKSNIVSSTLTNNLIHLSSKHQEISNDYLSIFKEYSIYVSLLSVIGDRIRSISSVHGYGIHTLKKLLESDIGINIQLSKTPETIGDIFKDDDIKTAYKNNFYCTSVKHIYDALLPSDIEQINTQLTDKTDINSLRHLNGTRFYQHPLLLDALLI